MGQVFCIHADGYRCEDVNIVGNWKSENEYSISTIVSLSDNSPIFENKNFCVLYLKEKSMNFNEFIEAVKKISPNSSFTFKEELGNINLKFTNCYGFGETECPFDSLKRKPNCFFYKLDKEQNLSEALSMCGSNLPSETERYCYYLVALKYANIDANKALTLCDKTIYFGAEARSCYREVAKILAKTNITKAVEICEKPEALCLKDIISIYQNSTNIEGKRLVYECLNYESGDKITGLICKFNQDYLANWHGHEKLMYAYGREYVEKSLIFCSKMDEYGGWKDICLKTRGRYIKEIEIGVSPKWISFLNAYPNGYGESYFIS